MDKPVYVIWLAGNFWDVKQKWKAICNPVQDFNVHVLDCGSSSDAGTSSTGDVILLLKRREMFDDRPRIIKLNGLPEDYTLLYDYLHLTSPKNTLVINAPFGYRNSTWRFIPAAASKFYKEVAKNGKLIDCGTDAKSNESACKWAETVCESYGKKIETSALHLLIQLCGKNYDCIHAEISKLSDYQTGKTIKEQDIKDCCVPIMQQSVWDFIDHLDSQNIEQAMLDVQRIYQNAGSATGKTFQGDMEMVMGALYHHFLFATMMNSANSLSYAELQKAVQGLKKKIKLDDGSYKWDKEVFESNFLSMAMHKDGIQQLFRRPKKHIYSTFLDLLKCRTSFRQVSYSESAMKLCIDLFILVACDIIPMECAELARPSLIE